MREKKTNGHTYLLRRYSVNFWDGILLSDQGSIQPFCYCYTQRNVFQCVHIGKADRNPQRNNPLRLVF